MRYLSFSRLQILGALLVILSIVCMPSVVAFVRTILGKMAAPAKPGTFSMAFITIGNMEDARKLSREMLEKKLVACVNIIPGVVSMYEWEQKIEEDSELIMMMKTRTDRINDISAYIRDNHPYDVAEVISTPITNGNPPYLEWLGTVVPDSGRRSRKTSRNE